MSTRISLLSLLLALGACAPSGGSGDYLPGEPHPPLPEATPDGGVESEDVALAEPEDVGAVSAALDSSWISGPYRWRQGQASLTLRSSSTHVCVLTKVSGDFDGGGEGVHLSNTSGYWRLHGDSHQSGVGAEAYCFANSGFLANGSARWSGNGSWALRSGAGESTGEAWWGDATTFLTGLQGRMRKDEDWARVDQSSGAFTPSRVRAHAGSGGYLRAEANSFFAGAPGSGRLARYWGGGTVYSADSTQRCVSGDGDHLVEMAPVNDAVCHLVSIGGRDWDGGGEYVSIEPRISGREERWVLRAHSGYCDASRQTTAQAVCYLRDQR